MRHNTKSEWAWGEFKTMGGFCGAVWTSQGVSALVLPQKKRESVARSLNRYLPFLPDDFWISARQTVPVFIRNETRKALSGQKFNPVPFDLSFLTGFQQKILKATAQIPWGETRTYGWVARRAGSPRGFRAAGQALNRNPVALLIPCHRVIAGANALGGYGGGLDWKIKLLKCEKVKVDQLSDGSYKVTPALIK